jgi:hypothetical protein
VHGRQTEGHPRRFFVRKINQSLPHSRFVQIAETVLSANGFDLHARSFVESVEIVQAIGCQQLKDCPATNATEVFATESERVIAAGFAAMKAIRRKHRPFVLRRHRCVQAIVLLRHNCMTFTRGEWMGFAFLAFFFSKIGALF